MRFTLKPGQPADRDRLAAMPWRRSGGRLADHIVTADELRQLEPNIGRAQAPQGEPSKAAHLRDERECERERLVLVLRDRDGRRECRKQTWLSHISAAARNGPFRGD
jgi:hypothetical protein